MSAYTECDAYSDLPGVEVIDVTSFCRPLSVVKPNEGRQESSTELRGSIQFSASSDPFSPIFTTVHPFLCPFFCLFPHCSQILPHFPSISATFDPLLPLLTYFVTCNYFSSLFFHPFLTNFAFTCSCNPLFTIFSSVFWHF